MVECRKCENIEKGINHLHSMSKDDKKKMVNRAFRYAKMNLALEENDNYCNTVKDIYHIEAGLGKLQDKKKLKNLFENLLKIMDEHAKKYLLSEDCNTENKEIKDYDDKFSLTESQAIFKKALKWYFSMKSYRRKKTVTDDDKRLFEWDYIERFETKMF